LLKRDAALIVEHEHRVLKAFEHCVAGKSDAHRLPDLALQLVGPGDLRAEPLHHLPFRPRRQLGSRKRAL
jgi:hypothetical protein